MNNKSGKPAVGTEKLLPIITLYIVSILIILIGTAFSIFSLINNVTLPVLSSQIPGVVFGAVMLFLGLRYLLSVNKLRREVFKSTTVFSWRNFKTEKKAKS